jgi:hypothetical protein
LTEGLSFGGVVWAAGASTQLTGQPVVLAGNVPLLTDLERAGGRHELRLRLQPGLSTLQLSPNWPILWWNLVNWRARLAPGLREQNVRLGGTVELQTKAATISVMAPQQTPRQLPVTGGRVRFSADTPGLVQINDGGTPRQLAVNALQQTESDLRKQAAGRWGNWANAADFEADYRGLSWALLLAALVLLSVHSWLRDRLQTSALKQQTRETNT